MTGGAGEATRTDRVSIRIRGERPGDEEAIDAVNCQAFRSRDEAHIVQLIRDVIPTFDRRLSVTAWDGRQMVGHTLFTPADIRLMGRTVRALAVAPVGVIPSHQRRGIGRAMLEYGHELGRGDRFALAFLNGHPSYYPRLGYRRCFGFAKITIDVEKLPPASEELIPWPVRAEDVPWLVQRFAAEWADVDFSWLRGSNLGEWTLPGANALIWRTRDGARAAYTLSSAGGAEMKMLLAEDPALAREVIAAVRPPILQHHPSGWLAGEVLDPQWATAEARLSPAAMAIELQEGVLEPVIQAVESGRRPPGFCNWPMPFIGC